MCVCAWLCTERTNMHILSVRTNDQNYIRSEGGTSKYLFNGNTKDIVV